ncbi:MAG: AraC family transcriptional regulator [Candidatus Omnitrophica bacterium]|nr:AraC family transcriptional regulator [Candidatus Omnitrophota bacterium]
MNKAGGKLALCGNVGRNGWRTTEMACASEPRLTLMVEAQRTNLTELTWLTNVTESRQPLNELRPIWVRHGTVGSGPPIPHPEHHPFCELSVNLQGDQIFYVEGEQTRRLPGDLFLAGPGVPHWAQLTSYPHQFISVYFLPSLLIELGPARDGARMLRRFTAPQSMSSRLVRPPIDLQAHFIEQLGEMVTEFESPQVGSEMRLRTILVELLVRLLRWEQSQVEDSAQVEANVDWQVLSRALQYLRTHFTGPIYARDLATATGVCQSRLEAMFREALGNSWVHFLQSYRIERAAALLQDCRYRVIDAALAVGFESVSHFNATFRIFMKVSPRTYQKEVRQSSSKSVQVEAS